MTAQAAPLEQERRTVKVYRPVPPSEAVYGFGLIGAWIYFIGHATGFWMVVFAILKGFVWPALVVYELLKYLGM